MKYPNRIQPLFKSLSLLCSALAAATGWPFAPTVQAQDPQVPAAAITVADGFQVELVYQVDPAYGSWVSMTTSPMGLITSDQYGKLYVVQPGEGGAETKVTEMAVDLGHAQGLLWAFDSLYVMAHGTRERPAGLYRVRDSSGDGQLDAVELLREINGGGEHGPHAIVLGPDQESLYICAGNHTKLTDIQSSQVTRNWNEDNLIERLWDPGGHAVGIMAPGGWVCKTDPNGKDWELISIGFRNQYDIAFNEAGELFTYDADMEWDIGTPWYRPTRVCHVTSGSEFGWRGGDAKWPEYYPDSVPAVIDIGPGSPTGIVFGTGARFPDRYQKALFIADWSFGFIYAIHLQPDGGTWKAEKELFCSAPALQVTDMIIHDGDLYFAIGGRRTQSALYRVSASTDESFTSQDLSLSSEQLTRRQVEAGPAADSGVSPVEHAWSHLGNADRFIRYAARTRLEQQPLADWKDRIAAETDPQVLLESLLAMCRHPDAGPADLPMVLGLIRENLAWDSLSDTQRLHLLRVCGLARMRLAVDGQVQEADTVFDELFSAHYPAKSVQLNRELSRLLMAANAPDVVARTLDLIDSAVTQEEQIHYVIGLRTVTRGWTPELRQRYLQWFVRSAVFQGGKSFAGYLKRAREEFVATLSEAEKTELGDLITVEMQEQDPYAELKAREVIQQWTVDALLPAVESMNLADRDLERGKRVFAMAQCYKCHQFAGSGGIVGPDLTGLSRRYTDQYLLETLIDPNKEISSQYQATRFELEDGRMVSGRIANLSNDVYMIQEDMISPGRLTNIKVGSIVDSKPSRVSPMPEQLLDSFTKEEVLDLIAYLRSEDQ